MIRQESKEKFLANCFIHKMAKQKQDVFLKKVSHIKFIRVQQIKAMSLLPKTDEEWLDIDRVFAVVNKGDFGKEATFSGHPGWKIFGVYMPDSLYHWFANNNIDTILKQIMLYNAAIYCLLEPNRPVEIASPYFSQIEKLMKKYFLEKGLWNTTLIAGAYNDAALDYCHSHVPDFLSIENNDVKEDIFLRTAYFSWHDWNRVVHHKISKLYKWMYIDNRKGRKPTADEEQDIISIPEELVDSMVYSDDLDRAESDQETWNKWLMTYRRYPLYRSHVFQLFGEESKTGYVYIVRAGLSNSYKIGWTRRRISKDAFRVFKLDRRSSLPRSMRSQRQAGEQNRCSIIFFRKIENQASGSS